MRTCCAKGLLVEDRYDLGFDDMEAAVGEFVEKIEPGDTAVFVYSGHGWSDGAHNYLVGVDAPDRASQERLTRLSLPIRNGATGVLDDFERKGAGLRSRSSTPAATIRSIRLRATGATASRAD